MNYKIIDDATKLSLSQLIAAIDAPDEVKRRAGEAVGALQAYALAKARVEVLEVLVEQLGYMLSDSDDELRRIGPRPRGYADQIAARLSEAKLRRAQAGGDLNDAKALLVRARMHHGPLVDVKTGEPVQAAGGQQ